MKTPTAKALISAATSVAGARGMGIETAASKSAHGLLATAEEWLAKNPPVQYTPVARVWFQIRDAANGLRASIYEGVGK